MLLGTGVPRRRRPKNGADRKSARGTRAMWHGRAIWHGTPVPPWHDRARAKSDAASRWRLGFALVSVFGRWRLGFSRGKPYLTDPI